MDTIGTHPALEQHQAAKNARDANEECVLSDVRFTAASPYGFF